MFARTSVRVTRRRLSGHLANRLYCRLRDSIEGAAPWKTRCAVGAAGYRAGQVRLLHHQDRQPRDFGTVGIGGRGDRVYTVQYNEFAAVVSNCPLIVFDPTRENALAHEHVNELVMKDFTVLPMSFGTVFRTENDIKEFLKGTYDALSDVLAEDGRQDRVRSQGELGQGPGHPRDRDGERRDPPAEGRDLSRTRRPRPTSRACSSAAWSSRRCRRRPTRT